MNVVSIVCIVLTIPLTWMLYELVKIEIKSRKRDRLVQQLLDESDRKRRYIC